MNFIVGIIRMGSCVSSSSITFCEFRDLSLETQGDSCIFSVKL